MNPTNIGILGFAHGHVFLYLDRWREQPDMGIRPVAGWDHDPERAARAAQTYGIATCRSPAELLARRDISGVVIAAETALHAELVEDAAAAGKTIVLQKPIALTLEEAERITRAAHNARIPFTLAWQMRVDPHNLQAKALIADPRFGRVLMVRRRHCLSTQLWKDFDKSWHVNPKLNRDIFADDACHPIDFIYWLLGMPSSVVAEMDTLLNPRIANDTAIALFRYKQGTFAEVSCSFVAVAGENTLEIQCENGVIIGNYGDAVSAAVRPAGAPQLKWHIHGEGRWEVSNLPEIRSQGDRIRNLARPLAEFLQGRRPPIASATEGRDVLKLVLACYESAQEGRRVMVES